MEEFVFSKRKMEEEEKGLARH